MRLLGLSMVVVALAQTPTFRTDIERVQVDVSATRGGRPVVGLSAADFVVTDNGVAQRVESVQVGDAPLDVQIVLDTSGSVSGARLQRLIDASLGLVDALGDADRAGLITFATAVEAKVPLTTDRDRVRRALTAVGGGVGATSLRDAVQLAVATPSAGDARVLVLVFSDGDDTMSWLRASDVVESARRSSVVVHSVTIGGSGAPSTTQFRATLADATGGRVFSASSDSDLARLFTSALDEMRARYRLTFTPRPAGVPGWHELAIKTRRAGIDVKARAGYVVNLPLK